MVTPKITINPQSPSAIACAIPVQGDNIARTIFNRQQAKMAHLGVVMIAALTAALCRAYAQYA
jgi:hypothetical protein